MSMEIKGSVKTELTSTYNNDIKRNRLVCECILIEENDVSPMMVKQYPDYSRLEELLEEFLGGEVSVKISNSYP